MVDGCARHAQRFSRSLAWQLHALKIICARDNGKHEPTRLTTPPRGFARFLISSPLHLPQLNSRFSMGSWPPTSITHQSLSRYETWHPLTCFRRANHGVPRPGQLLHKRCTITESLLHGFCWPLLSVGVARLRTHRKNLFLQVDQAFDLLHKGNRRCERGVIESLWEYEDNGHDADGHVGGQGNEQRSQECILREWEEWAVALYKEMSVRYAKSIMHVADPRRPNGDFRGAMFTAHHSLSILLSEV